MLAVAWWQMMVRVLVMAGLGLAWYPPYLWLLVI